VRNYYEEKGVHVSFDSDQYSTDFAKAMKILTGGYKDTELSQLDRLGPSRPDGEWQDIIIMSTMSGRLDQALGLLHELYREATNHRPGVKAPASLYFVSEQAVSFVLPIGKNVIRGIDPGRSVFRKHAGILPIYGPARISIKGFEWDVQDWETMMGGNVSTSNHVLGNEVEVEVVGEMVLFTIELADTGGLRRCENP
jgi:thiamine pyrophosphokinase